MHSYTSSISLTFLSHTHSVTHTHAIKQSASDQSQCCLRTPPPSAPSSVGCKHYPSKGSLEDTKTSNYLTPDTDLRALTVVYLGMKYSHTQTKLPELLAARSIHSGGRSEKVAVQTEPPPLPQNTLHNSTPPHPHPFSSPPYSCIPNTYQCLSNLSHIPKVDRSLCVCVCVSAHLYVHLEILVFTVPLSLCVPAWAVQRQLKANSGILNGSK